MDNNLIIENGENLLIYKNEDGSIIVDAILKDETLWLTQKGMAKVFDCSIDNISLHLKNIFKDNELDENSVTEKSSITDSHGKNYQMKIYNLFLDIPLQNLFIIEQIQIKNIWDLQIGKIVQMA